MKKALVIIYFFSTCAFAGIDSEFKVTKIVWNEEQKNYKVIFENQAGVYKAADDVLKCLQESMRNNKNVKINFNPMGLKINSCSTVASK